MSYEFFWVFVSYFADVSYWIGFAVSFLIVFPMLDRKDRGRVDWIIYALLPAAFLAYLANEILKFGFQVPRPCTGLPSCPAGYSFPSGHAAIISAFATIVSLYGKKYRSYLWAVPLAILVGLSRIFLGFHTPIDVVGGAAVGLASSAIVYMSSAGIERFLQGIKVLRK